MNQYSLTGDFYLHPTPAGAYHAVSRPASDTARHLIRRLLRTRETPRLTPEMIGSWLNLDQQQSLEFVYRMQSSGLLQGLPVPVAVPPETIEALLPPLLAQMSDTGQAVLSDKRGLYIGKSGFTHEAAEELAALAADLAALHERHARLLHGNLGLRTDGWGMVGASGYSELGFWPLHFGDDYFILVASGTPRFNQEAFTTLLWILGVRYGTPT
jgi:Roadblock/LC7 domain